MRARRGKGKRRQPKMTCSVVAYIWSVFQKEIAALKNRISKPEKPNHLRV